MKVVISGYYGFDNVGDEAILFSIIQALREIEPAIDITVLSNNPAHTEAAYQVKAVNRWSLPEMIKVIKASDGLISGGGSLLQDETGMKSIPYYAGVMKMALLTGKPVFVYAQGMGPIHKKINQWITKSVLSKTRITVRDEDSLQLLEAIGVKGEKAIVPDPVLGLKLMNRHSSWWEQQAFTEPVVTVSVRDWPSEVDFKGKIAEALDRLVEQGNTIVFIPMHGVHDDKASKETAKRMKGKSYIAPFDASIEEKITIIGESNLLLGMRLHALIFSSISYTPFIALSYDPKIDAFAQIAGQKIGGHVTSDTWEAEALFETMFQALQNQDALTKDLREKVEPLQKLSIETAANALQYFRKQL